MALFGYTNPDFLNRHQKETQSDGTYRFNGSWVKRIENFEETKNNTISYKQNFLYEDNFFNINFTTFFVCSA
jgi:hypothetical protein